MDDDDFFAELAQFTTPSLHAALEDHVPTRPAGDASNRKRDRQAGVAATSSAPSASAATLSPLEWACPACTLLNAMAISRCTVCDTRRLKNLMTPLQPPPSSWTCSQCASVNAADKRTSEGRSRCKTCNTRMTTAPPLPPPPTVVVKTESTPSTSLATEVQIVAPVVDAAEDFPPPEDGDIFDDEEVSEDSADSDDDSSEIDAEAPKARPLPPPPCIPSCSSSPP